MIPFHLACSVQQRHAREDAQFGRASGLWLVKLLAQKIDLEFFKLGDQRGAVFEHLLRVLQPRADNLGVDTVDRSVGVKLVPGIV